MPKLHKLLAFKSSTSSLTDVLIAESVMPVASKYACASESYAGFDEVKNDINLNYYYQYENNYFSLKRLSNCTFQMSYIYRYRSYDWVIYEDGSCDFLPLTKTWEEVEKEMNEPENPKMYWD